MEQAKISSSQASHHAHATKSKPVSQAAETPDAAGAGEFLALLAALGESVQDVEETADMVTGISAEPMSPVIPDVSASQGSSDLLSQPEAVQSAAADTSILTAWQGVWTATAVNAPAEGRLGQAVMESVSSIAASPVVDVGGAVPIPGGSLVGSPSAPGLPDAHDVPQGLVAETTQLDTATDLKEGGPLRAGTGSGRGGARLQAMLGAQAGAAQSLSLGVSPKVQALNPAAHSAVLCTPLLAGDRGGAALAAALERGAADRSTTLLTGAEGSMAAAMESALTGQGGARSGEFAGGGAGQGRDGGGFAAAWADGVATGAPQEPGGLDAAAVFADPSQAGAEEQVADRVAYWVHQKTQNAELMLDRDGQPVEVSVTLTGHEAHVAFRSDQAQTRELLDQSMAQLRELLRSEGLVLSGMSVGTSAGQGAGSSEQQRQREGGRQAHVVAAAAADSASLLRSGAAPNRAVDVFV